MSSKTGILEMPHLRFKIRDKNLHVFFIPLMNLELHYLMECIITSTSEQAKLWAKASDKYSTSLNSVIYSMFVVLIITDGTKLDHHHHPRVY